MIMKTYLRKYLNRWKQTGLFQQSQKFSDRYWINGRSPGSNRWSYLSTTIVPFFQAIFWYMLGVYSLKFSPLFEALHLLATSILVLGGPSPRELLGRTMTQGLSKPMCDQFWQKMSSDCGWNNILYQGKHHCYSCLQQRKKNFFWATWIS